MGVGRGNLSAHRNRGRRWARLARCLWCGTRPRAALRPDHPSLPARSIGFVAQIGVEARIGLEPKSATEPGHLHRGNIARLACFPSGVLVALFGPMGFGKATLLRILGGLEFPTWAGGCLTGGTPPRAISTPSSPPPSSGTSSPRERAGPSISRAPLVAKRRQAEASRCRRDLCACGKVDPAGHFGHHRSAARHRGVKIARRPMFSTTSARGSAGGCPSRPRLRRESRGSHRPVARGGGVAQRHGQSRQAKGRHLDHRAPPFMAQHADRQGGSSSGARKPRDKDGIRVLIQGRRGADLFDPACVHHHDSVGQRHCLDHGPWVTWDHGRAKVAVQPGKFQPHLYPQLGVEVREGSSNRKTQGLRTMGPPDGNTLALPA